MLVADTKTVDVTSVYFDWLPLGTFDSRLQCYCCGQPWHKPVQCVPCGHIMCRSCVPSWRDADLRCPECGFSVDYTVLPHPLLVEKADAVPGMCRFCGSDIKRGDCSSHYCVPVQRGGVKRELLQLRDPVSTRPAAQPHAAGMIVAPPPPPPQEEEKTVSHDDDVSNPEVRRLQRVSRGRRALKPVANVVQQ